MVVRGTVLKAKITYSFSILGIDMGEPKTVRVPGVKRVSENLDGLRPDICKLPGFPICLPRNEPNTLSQLSKAFLALAKCLVRLRPLDGNTRQMGSSFDYVKFVKRRLPRIPVVACESAEYLTRRGRHWL